MVLAPSMKRSAAIDFVDRLVDWEGIYVRSFEVKEGIPSGRGFFLLSFSGSYGPTHAFHLNMPTGLFFPLPGLWG